MNESEKGDSVCNHMEEIMNDHSLEICYYAMISGKSYKETIDLLQQAVIKKQSILDLFRQS